MRFRTFWMLLLLFAVLFSVASVWNRNSGLLVQQVSLSREFSISVAWMLVGFFGLGVFTTLLVGVSRELSLALERTRMRRASRDSEAIESEYSRGVAAAVEGHPDEALTHFRAVLERDSRHFNTLLGLGDVLRAQGRVAEAIEYHRKAHHLKEDSTRPLYALVEDYETKGDTERALAVLGKILGIQKGSVAAWRKLRDVHIRQRSWKAASDAQENVVKRAAPGDAAEASDRRWGLGIRYEVAVERLRAGKMREAIGLLRRVIREDKAFIPAHVKLGEALASQGQEKEAIQAWFDGFEATGSPVLLTMLEEYYLGREQPLAAIEALKSCISRARKDTLPRFYLGKLYFRLEMLDDAYAVLSALEGRASYAPTLHYLLGRIHERRGNSRQANSEYRRVIKEMDLVQVEYTCRACGATSVDWLDRCPTCGEWNSIEIDFREEISLEELGIAPAPIYSARP
jgi:lipopolysaccharide biosynthesis regulator YciM